MPAPVLSYGIQLWQDGEFDAALDYLKESLGRASDSVAFMKIIGQIHAERKDWGDCIEWMERVLKKDAKDVLAQYYAGISYRELGRYRMFLIRRIFWNRSRSYFEKVIAADPGYRDVFYQYSLLQKYREKYFTAVDLTERQVKIHPGSPDAIIGLYQHYDVLLNREDKDKVRTWLKEKAGNRAQYFSGESYRREGELNRADSTFKKILNFCQAGGFSPISTLLSMARLRIQQNRPDESQIYYKEAVEGVRSFIDAAIIFEDIKYVFSDDEVNRYEKLNTVNGKKRFLHKFWLVRDPLPAANVNFRIVEHYRRMLYAEENFRYPGLRTWFGDPNSIPLKLPRVFYLNEKFNDKGLVYIRHGEPANKVFASGEQYIKSESWLYEGDERYKKLIFHFHVSRNSDPDDWRLGTTTTDELLSSCLSWDILYHKYYTATSTMERNQYVGDLDAMGRSDALIGMQTDRHTWTKEPEILYLPFYISNFRGQNSPNRYEIYCALDSDDLWPDGKAFNSEKKATVGFAAFDERWNEIYSDNRVIRAEEIKTWSDSLGFWPCQFAFEAHAGVFYMNLFARVSDDNKLCNYQFNYTGQAIPRAEPAFSDIVLAQSVVPTEGTGPFAKKQLMVIPNPARTFSRRVPAFIYIELYNLLADESTPVSFRMRYTVRLVKRTKGNLLSNFFSLFSGSRPETSNTVERFTSDETSLEYLALDMSEKQPGQYELQVSAIIPKLNKTIDKKIEFDLQ